MRIIKVLPDLPAKLITRRTFVSWQSTLCFLIPKFRYLNFIAWKQLALTAAIASSTTIEGITMINKNQVQGTLKDAAGKVQEKAGQLIGSPTQEAKGLQKQGEGKAQKAVGDVKEVVQDAKDTLKDSIKNKG